MQALYQLPAVRVASLDAMVNAAEAGEVGLQLVNSRGGGGGRSTTVCAGGAGGQQSRRRGSQRWSTVLAEPGRVVKMVFIFCPHFCVDVVGSVDPIRVSEKE